jgi:glucokinase-like ROK family protein
VTQRYRTGDQALIREINLSIVLNQLWTNAPISRSQLAANTGLNKTTVSSLVHELMLKNFVREAGQCSSRAGRPAILIELNPDAGSMIGVEISPDFISTLLTNFQGTIEWRHVEGIDSSHRDHAPTLEQVIASIRRAMREAHKRSLDVLGIGVGVAGLVDTHSGTVVFSPNLDWHGSSLRDIVTDATGLPVTVDNDANLSALGEYYLGAAVGVDTFLYVAIGFGVGGGAFIGGRPYVGAGGYAAEFGHMAITNGDKLCRCGNYGCWEMLVSIPAVVARAQEAGVASPDSRMLQLTQGHIERIDLAVLVEAALAGDKAALDVMQQTGEYLGTGIVNLVNAFNPQMVVLGGRLSAAYPWLLPIAQRIVNQRAASRSVQTTPIMVSAQGEEACAFGAAVAILHRMITMPEHGFAYPAPNGRDISRPAMVG